MLTPTPSMGWMAPTHIGEGHLLYSAHPFKCSSLLETPSQTHQEMMLNQVSGYSVIQSSGHTRVTMMYWYFKKVSLQSFQTQSISCILKISMIRMTLFINLKNDFELELPVLQWNFCCIQNFLKF